MIVLFTISVMVYLIFFATPGVDPAARIAGRSASPATVEQVRIAFGLNRPLPIRYLLNGATQPSIAATAANKDWSYGNTYTVTINLPSGNAGNVKFSLLGGVSSTHGNSMGQRTIFPAFSCAGNTCTITAPPNANVCPPGWFMLFVLDGPTPSHAIYVRIGGDPAGLGNWPNLPDFIVPGV